MEHVLWTSCIRPSFEGEELLPAPTILLATYGTAFFRQKDVFLKLLAPLQEALRLDGTLMPNEVSKLAWMFSAARVYEHEMIPVVGDLALRTSDMRPTHLAQVSNGLGRILAAPNMEESILPTLQRVLEQLRQQDLGLLQTRDVQALAACFNRVPVGWPVVVEFLQDMLRFYHRKDLSSEQSLDPRSKVVLYRSFLRHQEAMEQKELQDAMQGLFRDTLNSMTALLVEASRSDQEQPWALQDPKTYQERLEEPNISEFDPESTQRILGELGVQTDWQLEELPEWEASAHELLERLNEVPFLESHPVPDRGLTMAWASWSLRSADRSELGTFLTRSGYRSTGGPGSEGYTNSPLDPLVPLVVGNFSRAADAEIQALALILQKAEKLGDLSRIAGVVHLVVTQTPCVSCLGAMAQFRALMPEVHLHCHFHRLRQEREARAADPRERRRSICSIYETTSGSSEGQPSFSDALEVFRRMLRVVSMEKEAELLNVLGAAGTAEEDHGLPLPESVMLPSPGTFHSLIGMAMAEGRVKEAIGLVKYQRLKELPVFARSLAMLAEDLRVPPRLAMRFLHESQVAGHLASRRLLSFLLRRLAKLDRPDASRLAVTFLRRCCRKEDSMGVYYRPDYPIPTIKRYPGSGTVAACLALAPSELLPRWARALGIWARCSQPDHEEDAAVPFRALMKRLTSHGGSVEETCRGEVLRALQATGLLERMVAQKVMDEDQVARVF
ncbi:unnamed protein product [Durusdinium trenchii]